MCDSLICSTWRFENVIKDSFICSTFRAAKPPAGSLICSTFSDISGNLDGYGARSAANFLNDSLICSTLSRAAHIARTENPENPDVYVRKTFLE